MPKYIDADNLKTILEERRDTARRLYGNLGGAVSGCIKLLDQQPAADVEPVNPDLPQWTLTSEHTPIIPGGSWGYVTVIAVLPGDKVSRPMIYERALVRKKWVERWRWIWDTICDETPVRWMPFPKPPKGEENAKEQTT